MADCLVIIESDYTELPVIGKIQSSPLVGASSANVFSDKVVENLLLQVSQFTLAGLTLS